jgi:hypothetical protein
MTSRTARIGEVFRATLDLCETGIDLMRQNIRRRDPGATDADVERRLREWLLERPGAKDGDVPGRSVDVDARLA